MAHIIAEETMLIPVSEINAGDEEDTRLLRAMATEARGYVTSFKWCLPIKAMYLADGVGGVVALFLVEFEGKVGGTDDRLWVVVGDLPSAYMVVGGPVNAKEALEAYCELMDDWINAVLVTHDSITFSPSLPPRRPQMPSRCETV